MKTLPKNWNYDQFVTFAMLYAASIDADISDEEESLIRKRVSEEEYREVKEVFDHCSDSECIDRILGYHDQFFATEEDRIRLLRDFREVFEADHKYSVLEREMMNLFRKML